MATSTFILLDDQVVTALVSSRRRTKVIRRQRPLESFRHGRPPILTGCSRWLPVRDGSSCRNQGDRQADSDTSRATFGGGRNA